MIPSQGSFCVLGDSSAAVWDMDTQKWYQENLRSGVDLSVSEGTFCALGENKAIAWNKKTKTWVGQPIPAGRSAAGSGG